MKTNLIYVLVLLLEPFLINAQNPEWLKFSSSNSGMHRNDIFSIVVDNNDVVWFGTKTGGLGKFDGKNWSSYTTDNSNFPHLNSIMAMTVDSKNNLWIGGSGRPGSHLVKYDGNEFTAYPAGNHPINCMAVDSTDAIWVGTRGGGLKKFDGVEWAVYDTSNSPLSSMWIWRLTIDSFNRVWGANSNESEDILFNFDGLQWNIYELEIPNLSYGWNALAGDNNGSIWFFVVNTNSLFSFDGIDLEVFNSPVNFNFPSDIEIDEIDNKWLAWDGGIAKFDNNEFTIYDTLINMFSDPWANCIGIDSYGHKWIGVYDGGIAVYREGGVLVGIEEYGSDIVEKFKLKQNYPVQSLNNHRIRYTKTNTSGIKNL